MDLYAPSRLPYDARAFRALFRDPPASYRGAPFWSWNGRLRREELLGQLARFATMGMGGAHVHPRTGLRTPYLSPEFLGHVRAAADAQAARQGLLWLYDEDRWPSGFAGGLVTRDAPEFRQRYLVLTAVPNEAFSPVSEPLWHNATRRNGTGRLLARYALRLDGPRLASWRRLGSEQTPAPGEQAWYAYLEVAETSPWFGHGSYLDGLSRRAVERFVAVTHEAYAAALAGHLGRTVPAIFTDEPQLNAQSRPERGARDLCLSWTDDFGDTYRARFGTDPLDTLPEVVWDRSDGAISPARWRYHDHRSERFAEAFAATLGRWCEAHGLALTGHLMAEDSPTSQAAQVGECMRSYLHFGIPGIDLLCDALLPATAKQAASVARQCGRAGVLSELYGVTGWHFDFTGHKRQGDWQAALGVTVRVHHLSWVSMAGESKRDYPAPIDWHSPWWREYRKVEEHFARLNTALTRGTPRVRVAVLHPVETTWHHYGPADGSGGRLEHLDHLFLRLTAALVESLIDFDFVAESLLPELGRERSDARLGVGEMAYDAVVVPWLATIRRSTLEQLLAFRCRGGRILVLGEPPGAVEGAHQLEATAWLGDSERFAEEALAELVRALEPLREIRAHRSDGSPAAHLYSQLRVDENAHWLMLCDTGSGEGPLTLGARGDWDVERFDTLTGTSLAIDATVRDGWTEWPWIARPAGHELVRLEPRTARAVVTAAGTSELVATLDGPARLSLDEPNVLLLDRAELGLGGEARWDGPLEILRLDNVVRARLGLPPVHGDIAQPWTEPPAPVMGEVDLRFTMACDIAVRGARLALEQSDVSRITLDGRALEVRSDGWWVDPCLAALPLPDLDLGTHELVISQPVRHDTTREWCYLLGEFGVRLDDDRREARLGPLPERLLPADQVPQGLPFYAGNATLEFAVNLGASGDYRLELGPYHAPLAAVSVDGRRAGLAAFPPYEVKLGPLLAGAHVIAVTVFGSRANAFGPVHLADRNERWLGPSAYRTRGAAWSDEWQLRPQGLASALRLWRAGSG